MILNYEKFSFFHLFSFPHLFLLSIFIYCAKRCIQANAIFWEFMISISDREEMGGKKKKKLQAEKARVYHRKRGHKNKRLNMLKQK